MFCKGSTAIVFFAAPPAIAPRCLNHHTPTVTNTMNRNRLTPSRMYVDHPVVARNVLVAMR